MTTREGTGTCCWHDILAIIQEKTSNPEALGRLFISEPPPYEKKKALNGFRPKTTFSFPLSIQSPNYLYLTWREAQCVALMIRGATNGEVAKKLGLSTRTVEFYVKNMRQKLDCRSKTHLVETIAKTDFIDHVDSILKGL